LTTGVARVGEVPYTKDPVPVSVEAHITETLHDAAVVPEFRIQVINTLFHAVSV
jgi:hypothetical protein